MSVALKRGYTSHSWSLGRKATSAIVQTDYVGECCRSTDFSQRANVLQSKTRSGAAAPKEVIDNKTTRGSTVAGFHLRYTTRLRNVLCRKELRRVVTFNWFKPMTRA